MQLTLRHLLVAATCAAGLAAQNDLRGVSFSGAAFALSSATGTGSSIGPSGAPGLNAMAKVGSQLLSVANNGNLVAIDPITGLASVLVATSPPLLSVRGMATDPAGVLYVLQNGGTGTTAPDVLYTLDVATGVATLVGTTSHPGLQGLGCDLIGTLYSWDVGSGSGFGAGLVTIDPVTAASTDVDPSTGNSVDVQCLAVSPAGVLYGARNSLYTIDTVTGAPTLVGAGGYTDLRGIEFVPGAGCAVFNGNQINPVVCNCATAPVLGASWDLTVTPAPATVLTLVFLALTPLPAPVPLFGGEALVAPPIVDIGSTGLGTHSVALPPNASFAGLALYAQGLRLNGGAGGLTLELTNGIAATLGF
jgi:hypothetical protein